ncbi:MAG: hypothetical protein P1U56_01465 [Saprospiraceae bacterium]|nr:hypothetical protein [Saprospiraceae bacterium]
MQHRLIAILFTIFACTQLFAQTNGNSPYSRFGIGDAVDDNFMHTRMMGSIGTSYIDGYHINIVNPASLATLRATAFDIGMDAKRTTLSSGDLKNTAWSGNLQYISLAFPLGNPLNELLDQKKRKYKLGMSFTLMPNSTVGYNITSQDSITGVGNFERVYAGNGGSYKFVWGNGIKYKDFSFGLNLGYLFGNIRYEQNITFFDLPFAYQDLFSTEYNLNGFLWGVGALYTKVLNQKKLENKTERLPDILSLGVRLKSSTSFNTNLTTSQFGVQTLNSTTQFIDTAYIAKDLAGSGKLPMEIGFGASYYKGEKFMIGADFGLTNWSVYNNDADGTIDENPLSDTYNVSFGGFFRPDYKSYNRYFKRVYYRYGLYYKTDPRSIDEEQLKSYGLTFGMGMPFIYQRKISHANIGFEFGRRGPGSPIAESFFKISLGFTFNDDEWFIKKKYN